MEKSPVSLEDRFILTPENTQESLRFIGNIREQKGSSEMLFPKIDSLCQQAKKIGDNTTALILYQEKFLCAQHMIMESKTNNPIRAAQGFLAMNDTVKKMTEFQKNNQNNIDSIVNARTFRFLGRFSDQLRQYKKSESFYDQGLDFFESLNQPEQRFHRLELSGFLAFSQLKQNKDTWFNLTTKTLSDFDKSQEGIWLKNNDYYTWAVWKSGIEIRTSGSLLDKRSNALKYKNNIISWLDDAGSILQMPNGNKDIFQIRLDELTETRSKSK